MDELRGVQESSVCILRVPMRKVREGALPAGQDLRLQSGMCLLLQLLIHF